MKILFFTDSLAGGGAERVVATLANHWARRSWDVTVVTLAPASKDFYVLDPAVRRVALALSSASRNPLDGALHNARRILALRALIRQLRPHAAIAMMSTPSVLLALAGRGIGGLSTIGSERCYPPHAPLGRLWSVLRRRTYGRLSAVVALTGECARWVETRTTARRVPVIPNAVAWPLPDTPPRVDPATCCVPGRRILLAVGRLDAVKNFGMLVGVFAGLAATHPDWDLVILGEGPERTALERATGASSLRGRVFLPGIAGNVGAWHARADLYVLCSHSEGFPNALAEALCHGVAAVSVDCDTGPRDIVRHGVDGLLVAPGDVVALSQGLGRLMANDELRQRFGANAREARLRFGIERIAGLWEALFRELARNRAAAGRTAAAHGGRRYEP